MNDAPDIVCRLCGAVIRASDAVVELGPSDPPVVHASCAEAAHVRPSEWDHTDPRTLSEWARAMGMGSGGG